MLVIENGQVLNVSATPGLRSDRLVFNGGKDGALALELFRSNRLTGLLLFAGFLVIGLSAAG